MAELIQKQDTLNEGRVKLNAAITDAEQAKITADGADTKATQALANSESTQSQLDTIVINGDSSVEAAQARVDEKGVGHTTLKDRIDDGFTNVTSQLTHIEVNVNNHGVIPNIDSSEQLHSLMNILPEYTRLRFPSGNYIFSVSTDKAFHYDFDSDVIITPVSGYAIQTTGTLLEKYRLNKNVDRGERILELSTVHDISVGDYIYLRDDSIRPFDGLPDINGEIHKVEHVTATAIVVADKIRYRKSFSSSYNVAKIKAVSGVVIGDVTIDVGSSTLDSGGIRLENCVDSNIGDITVSDTDFSAIMIKQCYNTKIKRLVCNGTSVTDIGGYGYGLSLTNSINVYVDTLIGSGMRHTFDNSSSYEIHIDNIQTYDDEGASVFVSHNSFGGDMYFKSIEINQPLRDGVIAFNQGVQTNVEDYSLHNLNIGKLIVNGEPNSAQMAFHSLLPLIDCNIGDVIIDGVTNNRGVRILCYNNKVTFNTITMNGGRYALWLDTSETENKPIKDDTFIIVNHIQTKDTEAPLMFDNGLDFLKLKGHFENGGELIYLRKTKPEVEARYLELDISFKNFNSIAVTPLVQIARTNKSGVFKFNNISNPILDVTVANGVDLNDLLLNITNTLLKVKTDTIDHNIAKGFGDGLIGQTYTLVNVGENRISIGNTNPTFKSKDGENKLIYGGESMTIVYDGKKWLEI